MHLSPARILHQGPAAEGVSATEGRGGHNRESFGLYENLNYSPPGSSEHERYIERLAAERLPAAPAQA